VNEWLIYLYTALPFAVALACASLAVAGIGIGLVAPRLLVYAYLAVFFLFNSANYGNLQVLSSAGIYTRGSGLLYFSLLLWLMLGIWCCALASTGFARDPAPQNTLKPWFWGWFLLLLLHLASALFLGHKPSEALAPGGFANIVWMAPLVSLLLMSFRTRAQVIALGRFIMLMGLGRAVFGLARWAFAGGDPNNVYANMNAVRIELTFFDINDSMLCALAFAIAAVQLFQPAPAQSTPAWRKLEWLTLAATAACIVLSYRRSAWIGFVLACLVIVWRFPWRRRLQLAAAGVPLLGAAIAAVALRRLSQTRGAGAGLESVVYDMQSQRFGAESQRVLELKFALADFLAHPLTGIGAWGRYEGFERISWQGSADGGSFIHSGVLHIALKAGVPGLILFGGLAWAFAVCARRALRELPPDLLGLGTAGVAGVALMLPDFLVGTPIPQVRTTQMIALCLALPYLALAAQRVPVRP
jgi:hypothetical protein